MIHLSLFIQIQWTTFIKSSVIKISLNISTTAHTGIFRQNLVKLKWRVFFFTKLKQVLVLIYRKNVDASDRLS